MIRLVITALLLAIAFGHALAVGTPRASSAIPPPAGRALLSRGANLEPYDYPASVQSGFDAQAHIHPSYSILGPPGFWTEASLREHYDATHHLRYHPDFYPVAPPFEVWLKEQQIIRAINMLSQTIELETSRSDLDRSILLEHEMQLGELSILLRQTQIATSLKYAILPPEWRKFEESMYRHWAGFLQVSHSGSGDGQRSKNAANWQRHVEYLERLGREKAQEYEENKKYAALYGAAEKGKKTLDSEQQDGWRTIPIEKGDPDSGTQKRRAHKPNLGTSASPERWAHSPEAVQGSSANAVDGLQEAFGKGFHL